MEACHLSHLCDFTPFGRSIAQPPIDEHEFNERYELTPLIGAPEDGEEIIEHEIYIAGHKVVWSSGGRLFKTLNLPSSVRQAIWCTFASESAGDDNRHCLCVLHIDGLTIYTSGFIYPVVLPCKVRQIWALPAGLLLERDQSEYELSDSQTPSLFSLLHPLEDVFPVAIRSEPAQDGTDAQGGTTSSMPMHLPKHQVLYSSSSFPLLVIYDFTRCCHTFWTIEDLRPSPEDALPPVPTPTELAAAPPPSEEGLLFHPQLAISCFHTATAGHEDEEHCPPSSSIFECTMLSQAKSASGPESPQAHTRLEERSLLCLLRRDLLGQTVAVDALALSFDEADRKPSLAFAFSHPAMAAVGVRLASRWRASVAESSIDGHCSSSSSATHLLVLHPNDRSLRLYAGAHFLATCSLRVPPAPTDKATLYDDEDSLLFSPVKPVGNEGATQTIVDLRDAVGNRVNALLSSGRTVRISVDTNTSSPLVQDCLDSLRCVLPLELTYDILYRLLQEQPTTDQPHHEPEWHSFTQMLLALFSVAYPVINKSGAKPPPQQQKLKLATGRRPGQEDDEHWRFLISTEYHHSHHNNYVFHSFADSPRHVGPTDAAAPALDSEGETGLREEWKNRTTTRQCFLALHLVYENYKLSALRHSDLLLLAGLNYQLALRMGWTMHVDYYLRDFPHLFAKDLVTSEEASDEPEVSSINSWLHARLGSPASASPAFPTLPHGVLDNTRKICRLYDILLGGDGKAFESAEAAQQKQSRAPTPGRRNTPEEATVFAIVEEGLTQKDIEVLPFGVALPLQEAIAKCRVNPPSDWPVSAYTLIGRDDIAVQFSANTDVSHYLHRNPAAKEESDEQKAAKHQSDDDDEVLANEVACLRFGRDQRLKAVLDMLLSSKPIVIAPVEQTGVTDHEAQAEQQAKLGRLAQRTAALSVGRGMFTLNSKWPLLTEPISIPPLVMDGKERGSPGTTALDRATLAPDLFDWAQFHNGVATGLRLVAAESQESGSGGEAITSTWIAYNRPNELSNEHAGFLMALGLQGHLSGLGMTKVFEYLSKSHEMTSMGLLLGMAATRRGTMDAGVAKLLSIHLPALLPPSSTDLDVGPWVQIASLIGVGLLYQGTADRHMVEVLLKEIGKPPGDDRRMDREAYSLTAGLALGLVALARGSSAPGLADLHIEDRLHRYIYGGREEQHGAYIGYGGAEMRASKVKSSLVLEPGPGNVDITSPGATLALGLMWLKTNSAEEAARIQIPDTRFLLMSVRPDLLLVRVLSKNLILWDAIEPSEEWLMRQLPAIMRQLPRSRGGEADAMRQAQACMVAGACMALGLRFAGSANQQARTVLTNRLLYFIKRAKTLVGPEKQDRQIIGVCINVASLALAVVMAGTGDLDTLRILRRLHRRISPQISYGDHMATHMAIGFLFLGAGRYTLSTSNEAIGALVCALYPHFPITPVDNRYHMQALRHLYVLAVEPRCLVARDVDTHQACYLPLQVLTTGAGQEGTWLDVTAPCLLPEYHHIKAIRVASPRYWAQTIDLAAGGAQAEVLKKACTIYVKRKTGFLSYLHDPTGCRSILSRPFPNTFAPTTLRTGGKANGTDFIRSFSQDPTILAFAQHFCRQQEGEWHDAMTEREDRFAPFCAALLYECLTKEKPEMIKTYISLYEVVRCVEQYDASSAAASSSSPSSSSSASSSFGNDPLLLSIYLQNVRLIATYYNATARKKAAPNADEAPLIQPTLFNSFLHRLHSHFIRRFELIPTDVKRAYFGPLPSSSSSSSSAAPTHDEHRRALALMLAYYDLPHPQRLRQPGQKHPPRPATFVQLALRYPHVSPSLLSAIHRLLE